jgi:PTH1 family peptidyl-tRNA hydrolase
MSWKRLALGIGNPGAEYEQTRHNAGFMVLDRVAQRLRIPFSRLSREAADGTRLFSGKVKAQVAEGSSPAGAAFLLVKPSTYVNCSGDVAGALLRHATLAPDSLFVIVDDLNLPLGRIRVRPSGSSGGHNGLRSIEQALGSQEYPRLRLGIGAPGSTMVDHVLDVFSVQEREVLDPALDRAADAVALWLNGAPIELLMDRYNGHEPTPPTT